MLPDEFVILVGKMRTAQKNYFKGRLSKDLFASKDYERQVDKALVEGVTLAKVAPAVQVGLFGEENKGASEQ